MHVGSRDEEIVRMVGASKHRRKVWRAERIGGNKHVTIKNFKERDKLISYCRPATMQRDISFNCDSSQWLDRALSVSIRNYFPCWGVAIS